MIGGFPDLTQGSRDAGGVSDSFWPSVTDIMTVVVMIFMLASTVLIVRNWELLDELRKSVLAEKQASAIARHANETNATLEERLAQTQHELSLARMQLLQAAETDKQKSRTLAERERQIQTLSTQQEELQAQLKAGRERTDRLTQQLAQQTQNAATLQGQLTTAQNQLQSVNADYADLQRRHQAQTAELETARSARADSEQQLADLRGNFDQLKVKYDKLVRPARTAQGKHVVEVRYEKRDGKYQINLREDDGPFEHLNRAGLDQRLNALKAQFPDQLYVKIVIPEKSGLSYNEAWQFTKDILQRYDYYYTE